MKYQEISGAGQSADRYFVRIKKSWDKPEVRTFSAATATLFLIAFFLFIALKPTVETIFLLNKKIADARVTEKLMTEKIQALNIGLSTYSQIESDIPRVDNYLPQEPKVDEIIEILLANFQKSKMASSDFSIPGYKLEGATEELSVKNSGKAPFNNVMLFMQNLLSANRIFSIDNVTLGKSEKENGVDFNFDSKIYYEKK